MMATRARSTAVPGNTYGSAMRLARLRRFGVLLAGLAMPALASTLAQPLPARADGAAARHIHADGMVRSHAKPAQAIDQQAATPAI
jgi:hypothetical protein